MQFKIGAYIRISKENTNNESIVNQENIIKSYIESNAEFNHSNVTYYTDNGYSGSNFERPEMKKLIEDIKSNKINCIVVKDLSRFGRNYIEVSNYIEKIFPFLNIRFIAINDNYDIYKDKNSICDLSVSFKNIIHNYYIKDLSVKIKTGHRASAKQGNYIKTVPFGYKRNKKTKRLEIDEETAPIVKRIFELFVDGYKLTDICKILNSENIPTINQYKNKNFSNTQFWKFRSIKTILKNEVYTGDTVNFKTKPIKCGSKKCIKNNEEDILIIENTHPAIIEKDIFLKVNELLNKRTRVNKSAVNKNIFSNKLKCGCCGYGLKYNSRKNKGKKYFCGSRYEHNNTECLKVFIDEDNLNELIIRDLKDKINIYLSKKNENNINEQDFKRDIIKNENQVKILMNRKVEIYEKYIELIISKEEYLKEKIYIEQTLHNLKENLDELNLIIENLEDEKAKDYKENDFENLTKDIIDNFIEKIYIYDKDNIEIFWK